MTSLKEAMQAAEAAAKATEEAQALQLQAEQKVAEVRSAESREKIMKLLQQVREYAVEMKNFDSELQKEVKKELRTIVKCAYGDKYKIKKDVVASTTLKYNGDEVVKVLKDAGANDENTGISSSMIEEKISIIQGIDNGKFNPNTWSGRDKNIIQSNNNNKNMVYWV